MAMDTIGASSTMSGPSGNIVIPPNRANRCLATTEGRVTIEVPLTVFQILFYRVLSIRGFVRPLVGRFTRPIMFSLQVDQDRILLSGSCVGSSVDLSD